MSEALAGLPNSQLLVRVRELVQRGNVVEADLLAHLAEVDARRLYLREGCSSMFVWCQRVLHFAEGVAYKRIQAARAVRRHPQLLGAVRSGELHLTAVSLLAPKLTQDNCADLIRAARHRSTDEIRQLLADREPRQVVSYVRPVLEAAQQARVSALPQPALSNMAQAATHEPSAPPPAPRQTIPERGRSEPLGGERYRVQFMADRETHAQLDELRRRARSRIAIAKVLLERAPSSRCPTRASPTAPRSIPRLCQVVRRSTLLRRIPAAIRRAVSERRRWRPMSSAGAARGDSSS